MASPNFVEGSRPELLRRWEDDLVRFTSLRASVTLRYAERVKWHEYEKRIRQLLDRHVVAREVVNLVEPLNIFRRYSHRDAPSCKIGNGRLARGYDCTSAHTLD